VHVAAVARVAHAAAPILGNHVGSLIRPFLVHCFGCVTAFSSASCCIPIATFSNWVSDQAAALESATRCCRFAVSTNLSAVARNVVIFRTIFLVRLSPRRYPQIPRRQHQFVGYLVLRAFIR